MKEGTFIGHGGSVLIPLKLDEVKVHSNHAGKEV